MVPMSKTWRTFLQPLLDDVFRKLLKCDHMRPTATMASNVCVALPGVVLI